MTTHKRRGSAVLEFALAGIPLLFMTIGIVELSRGMWIYDTLAHAVQVTGREMAVQGINCVTYVAGCGPTVGGYSRLLQSWAVGLDPGQLEVDFQSATQSVQCHPLNSCFTDSAPWPPAGDNVVNLSLWISVKFPFQSALGDFMLSAQTHQQILY